MDIAARPDDPAVEEMARSIYALFPRCMRCGEVIARYEDADVRVLTHRVVHRAKCVQDGAQEGSGLSTGMPGDG
jgi:hypothetical protein